MLKQNSEEINHIMHLNDIHFESLRYLNFLEEVYLAAKAMVPNIKQERDYWLCNVKGNPIVGFGVTPQEAIIQWYQLWSGQ